MKHFISSLSAMCLVAALFASGAHAQQFNSDGWWVVLAAFREDAADRDAAEAAARNAAAQCGVEAFNDFSNKFEGFAPGLTVVVVWSAFQSKSEANTALKKVRPCIADAYIKKARYLGE